MIPAHILTMIRSAINDPESGGDYANSEISDTWEALNQNSHMTVAHFFLAKAAALTWPTAPTAPTLDDAPDSTFAYWEQKAEHDLAVFQQELALYREKLAAVRAEADIYRAQASLWMNLAEGGEVL